MIIQKLPDKHLLCIRQTTHALLAHEFCCRWGNDTFARPEPYSSVMLAISQHDNGWYEWEEHPRLCNDGSPMDFLLGPTAGEKRALWIRSVDRVLAQHPYSGLLVARHATFLYESNLAHTPDDEQQETVAFLQNLAALPNQVRRLWQDDDVYGPALSEKSLLANTHLLKFGDSASLQVCIPWEDKATLHHCPVDGKDEYVDIAMTVHEGVINFDPWPFAPDHFEVGVHGRLLIQTHFASEAAYHAALRHAPIQRLSWTVAKA